MAKSGENRMNLAALQRVDPDIRRIIDNASQVALYKFSPKANEWEKTEIEGTLFIYVRIHPPHHGFIIMNRLNTTNWMESITEELDFQSQTPFLLYRNAKGSIYGIWFYEKEECTRFGELLNSVKANQQIPCSVKIDSKQPSNSSQQNNIPQQKNNQRQRCASESDSRKVKERKYEKTSMKDIDIISLLSRAQDEYDKKTNHCASTTENRTEPKRVVQSITVNRKHDSDVIKPTPVRANEKKATPLSVDSLFAQASGCQEVYLLDNGNSFPGAQEPQLRARSLSSGSFDAKNKDNAGTILHRLLSNPANTVEHIEKLQRNEATEMERTKQTETYTNNLLTVNVGQSINETNKQHSSSVESLEQDIKKRLKLISPSDDARKECTSPNVTAAANSKSPATIIEESSNFLLMENQSNGVEQMPAGPSKKPNIHPILTPAAFENCGPLNNFNDHSELGNIDTFTTNDTFKAAIKSLEPTPGPVTLISPMVFAMTNNINGTIKHPSPLIEKTQLDILQSNSSQLGTSQGISGAPATTGLLLPQHLVNGIVPAVNKCKDKQILKHGITPLTKDQLKDALLYMLQNDVDFLSKIHESYINSLKTHLNSTKS